MFLLEILFEDTGHKKNNRLSYKYDRTAIIARVKLRISELVSHRRQQNSLISRKYIFSCFCLRVKIMFEWTCSMNKVMLTHGLFCASVNIYTYGLNVENHMLFFKLRSVWWMIWWGSVPQTKANNHFPECYRFPLLLSLPKSHHEVMKTINSMQNYGDLLVRWSQVRDWEPSYYSVAAKSHIMDTHEHHPIVSSHVQTGL